MAEQRAGEPAGTGGAESGRLRVAVLVSGRGSNMMSLLREAGPGIEVALVVSNNPDAPALQRARAAGVEAVCVDHRAYRGERGAHEAAIDAALRAHGIGLVCLAGYLRLLTALLVGRWQGRMLNIHPSLLPAFPGLHTHERALAAGVRLHGCTVHWVTQGMDEGPIVAQAAVPVLPGDSADSLGARVLAQEHRLYPLALRLAAGLSQPQFEPQAFLCSPALAEGEAAQHGTPFADPCDAGRASLPPTAREE